MANLSPAGLIKLSYCLVALSISASADTIRLRADRWYPYNGDPMADKPGFMVEIARQVFESAGHSVDYQLMPWTRAIKEAGSGEIDGIVGAARGDAPNFIFPHSSLGQTSYVFYVNPSSKWTYADLDSLSRISVGYIADYSYGETFDSYRAKNSGNPKRMQATRGDTALELAIGMLQRERIDAVVSSPDVFSWTVASLGLNPGDFRMAGRLPEVDQLYIAFSPARKNSGQYAQLLSNGVDSLRRSGDLARILARYGVTDWSSSQ